ncbi:Glyoxalase/Bleomycin resistance protein/Dihydroxybiphenyl dioxygenase [Powellomyces hirtus]|nr:Glyoxalase/Bleomycin resistance protein/Dihydroxybiphenyl dioxygenase [Powellomyces hirtus]
MNVLSILKSEYPGFIHKVLTSLSSKGITVSSSNAIDHICYRTSTLADYDLRKTELAAAGTLLVENLIGGRNIAVYKLYPEHALTCTENISVNKDGAGETVRTIDVIELPSPKVGRAYPAGVEHVEIVLPKSEMTLEEFAAKHSSVEWNWSGIKKTINRDLRVDFRDGGVEDGGFAVKFHEQTLEEVIMMELAAEKGWESSIGLGREHNRCT